MSITLIDAGSVDRPGSSVLISEIPDKGAMRICFSADALLEREGVWVVLLLGPQLTRRITNKQSRAASSRGVTGWRGDMADFSLFFRW
jgi:hypothetical protein